MSKRGALDQKVVGLDAEIAEMERVLRFFAKHGAKSSEAATVEIARLKDIRGYLTNAGDKPAAVRSSRAQRAAKSDPADETTRMAVDGK